MMETADALIVLSGGEPFEHPEIAEILMALNKQKKAFRIATGGFVNLNPWINNLKILSANGPLQGISMGTDVISSRVNHSNWVPVWKNNIKLFFEYQIPILLHFHLEMVSISIN
jgi:hypothetical protein